MKAKRAGFPWSEEDIDYLKKNRKQAYSVTAEHLGRTVAAVNGKYCMLAMDKVKVPPWTEADIEALRNGVSAGMSDEQIAKKLKRSANAVRQRKIILRKDGKL